MALADRDQAFTLLFRQIERDAPGPNFAPVEPTLDELRSDPRWKEVVQRLTEPRGARATVHERSILLP